MAQGVIFSFDGNHYDMPERGGFQMLGEFLYDFSLMSANAYITSSANICTRLLGLFNVFLPSLHRGRIDMPLKYVSDGRSTSSPGLFLREKPGGRG